MHHRNTSALCIVCPTTCFFLCHHLKSYTYVKNDLALLIILLLVNHCHVTCQTAQGLYMEFIFGFSVKTVKVSQWAGGELWCMATTSDTALGFYEIKNSNNQLLATKANEQVTTGPECINKIEKHLLSAVNEIIQVY